MRVGHDHHHQIGNVLLVVVGVEYWRAMITTKFKCVVCGKITAGRIPRATRHDVGDGSVRFPRFHLINGSPCAGNYKLAEWVSAKRDGDHGQESSTKI
jgi:hypothetical protein